MPEIGLSVWAALTDPALEKRLRHYLWQKKMGGVSYGGRVGQLVAEAERRGKRELVDKAQRWVDQTDEAPLL